MKRAWTFASASSGSIRQVMPYLRKCRALIHLDRADEAIETVMGLDLLGASPTEVRIAQLEILRTCGRREALALIQEPAPSSKSDFSLWLEQVLTRLTFYDLDGAEADLRTAPAIRTYERSRVCYVQGMLADLRWQVDDAITAFEHALSMHADDPGAHHHLARLYFLRGDAEQSQAHLTAMVRRCARRFGCVASPPTSPRI